MTLSEFDSFRPPEPARRRRQDGKTRPRPPPGQRRRLPRNAHGPGAGIHLVLRPSRGQAGALGRGRCQLPVPGRRGRRFGAAWPRRAADRTADAAPERPAGRAWRRWALGAVALVKDLGRPERFLQHAAHLQGDLADERGFVDPQCVQRRRGVSAAGGDRPDERRPAAAGSLAQCAAGSRRTGRR